MQISKVILTNLLKALTDHKVRVSARGTWKNIHDQYNIGTLDLSKSKANYYITSSDRIKITELLKASGINPAIDTVESLKNKTRTEISAQMVYEKSFAKNIKQDYITLRIIGEGSTQDGDFRGMTFKKAFQIDFDYILVIENFETFIDADISLLPLPQKYSQVAIIYRGDKESSPRGLTQFLDSLKNKSKVYYWGDFDPIGISIAMSKEKYNAIILPVIGEENLSKYSKTDTYYKHDSYIPRLEKIIVISSFIEKMKNEQLAITQELMMSLKLPLLLKNIN
jgi:hypothetical protein